LLPLSEFEPIKSGPSRGHFGIRRTCKPCRREARRERNQRKLELRNRERDRKLATRIRQASVAELAKLLTKEVFCRMVLDNDEGSERLVRSLSYRVFLSRSPFNVPGMPRVFPQLQARRFARTTPIDKLREFVTAFAAELLELNS
jgi:hypothetical protein